MRYVCPREVKNMLLQRARTVYWKTWAAKQECEELKEAGCRKSLFDSDWSDESECEAYHKEKAQKSTG